MELRTNVKLLDGKNPKSSKFCRAENKISKESQTSAKGNLKEQTQSDFFQKQIGLDIHESLNLGW